MKDQNTCRVQAGRRFSFVSSLKATIAILMLCLGLSASAQNITVTGTVEDASGEPLMGATVLVAGTTNGVATDFDGNFSITNVSPKGKLEISYVGYKPETIAIDGRTNIKVVLQEDSELLDEVVVVGYGTMKKSDLTGSVSSVGTEKLNAKGAPSVLENLQGTAPGVNISKNNSRANGGLAITIRGKASINSGTTPLFVVDGVMCSDIDFLNPQDIERIDILKDASSTAIYGSRATAGVVIVTTKGGLNVNRDTKTSVSYDGYYGINHVARMPEFADGQQAYNYRMLKFTDAIGDIYGPQNTYSFKTPTLFGQALLQTVQTDYSSPFALKELLANNDTYDWPSLVTQNGSQQNHYLAFSGSNDKVNYHFGVGINSEDGVYKGDSHKTYSFKGSVDARVNKVISGGFNFNVAYMENSYANDNAIAQAYRVCTFFRPYNEDGSINHFPGNKDAFGTDGNQFSDFVNPLDRMRNTKHEKKTYRALGNIYLQLDIIPGLNIKTTFSPSFSNYRDGSFTGFMNPNRPGNTFEDQPSNSAYADTKTNVGFVWDNMVTFSRTFNKIHSVNVMALASWEKANSERYKIQSSGVLEGSDWYHLKTEGLDQENTMSEYAESSMNSYALRGNYSFKDRYMITATMRWDGSSKLAPGHRWVSFPSVALAWRLSEESFLRDVDWISNLKLRLAYGKTGNNAGIGNYDYLVGINGPVYYPFGNSSGSGYFPGSFVDKKLTWETSKEYNIGLDFGFLNSRINGSIELYDKKSSGLLYKVVLPYEVGAPTMATNIGKIHNKGIEVSLQTINITNRTFEWSTNFTFSANKNRVNQINGVEDSYLNGATNSLMVGQSGNSIWSYNWEGIVSDRMMTVPDHEIAKAQGFTPGQQVRECDYYYACYGLSEGQPYVTDRNGDGTIDNNDKFWWSSDPKWIGSLTSNMSYNLPKNGGMIDFAFSLYAVQGQKVYSEFMNSDYYDYHDRGRGKMAFDYYIPAGAIIDADGMRADGTFINPVYQETTHYGSYPYPNAGLNDGLGPQKSYWDEAKSVCDASYVKVKNISLGYTFHKNVIKHIGASNLRIYFNVLNPFVWTKYKGFDPEWADAAEKNDGPSIISYQIGASLKF
ncbi:MAG: TonB-dependent receptor [Duncaniella sp.]|nr:TonB-dependent receptor [Duncaniella sp.]